jgi:hypothetical protein
VVVEFSDTVLPDTMAQMEGTTRPQGGEGLAVAAYDEGDDEGAEALSSLARNRQPEASSFAVWLAPGQENALAAHEKERYAYRQPCEPHREAT